jgi:hypothetical protein
MWNPRLNVPTELLDIVNEFCKNGVSDKYSIRETLCNLAIEIKTLRKKIEIQESKIATLTHENKQLEHERNDIQLRHWNS